MYYRNQRINTVIEVDQGNYKENVIVTELNIKQVRALINDLEWSYFVEGDVIIEKPQNGLISKYKRQEMVIIKIEEEIKRNVGAIWTMRRQKWLEDRQKKAYAGLAKIEEQLNRASLLAIEER